MSLNHEVDYDALADKIASDDYDPGPSWSLLDVAEVRAFELLKREYDAALRQHPEISADEAFMRFLQRGRDDAERHLVEARTRAQEAGVPADFIESVTVRDSLV